MADEKKDVEKFLKRLDALAASRRLRLQNRSDLLNDLEALLNEKAYAPVTWRTRAHARLRGAGNWVGGRVYRLITGRERPEMDLVTTLTLDDLRESKNLSKDEVKICAFWRIARCTAQGGLQISEQPKALSLLGKVLVAPVAIAIAFAVTTFLNLFIEITTLAQFGYPIGAVLGKTSRALYYSTWGWQQLALKLSNANHSA